MIFCIQDDGRCHRGLLTHQFHLRCGEYVVNKLFHCLSTRERPHIMFFQMVSAPKPSYKAFPLSSKALFLLKPSNSYRHNYTRMRSTCCASTAFLEQLTPARQAVQWEVERREGERGCELVREKSPFMFVKEEERAVIITLEALDCNFSPLCVNLCIHQVFRRQPLKRPHSSCLHLSVNTTDKLSRELAIYMLNNGLTITSCV